MSDDPDPAQRVSEESDDEILSPDTRELYRHAVSKLTVSGVPFLVGGAYALKYYTGIVRRTKDLDIFVLRSDVPWVLSELASAGLQPELTDASWLAKAWSGKEFIDVIFGAMNGMGDVSPEWFAHAVRGKFLDLPVMVCPAEEMIWSKAFVMERERYDGADIAHLILARAEDLDWKRLVGLFGSHWQVLLMNLVFFGYLYPSERNRIPAWVMRELIRREHRELGGPAHPRKICRGPVVSRTQYLIDIGQWGFKDSRLVEEEEEEEGSGSP